MTVETASQMIGFFRGITPVGVKENIESIAAPKNY